MSDTWPPSSPLPLPWAQPLAEQFLSHHLRPGLGLAMGEVPAGRPQRGGKLAALDLTHACPFLCPHLHFKSGWWGRQGTARVTFCPMHALSLSLQSHQPQGQVSLSRCCPFPWDESLTHWTRSIAVVYNFFTPVPSPAAPNTRPVTYTGTKHGRMERAEHRGRPGRSEGGLFLGKVSDLRREPSRRGFWAARPSQRGPPGPSWRLPEAGPGRSAERTPRLMFRWPIAIANPKATWLSKKISHLSWNPNTAPSVEADTPPTRISIRGG